MDVPELPTEAGRVVRRDDAPRTPTADAPGRGARPAGPAGLSVRARAAGEDHLARLYSASMHGVCGFDQPPRQESSSERGPRGSTRRPGGTSLPARCSTSLPRRTELPGAGRGGRPACPVGLSVRALAAGDDHPARLYSASMHGVCGFDQPARLDSSSERGPRRSTIRPGGTQPPGAGQRGWISRAGGTQPPVAGRGGRPAGPSGLSL